MKPRLAEAKRQLAEEPDYVREGEQIRAYGKRLQGDSRHVVPALNEELPTRNLLTIDFVEGRPIKSLENVAQDVRGRAMTAPMELLLQELFAVAVMQTDPNFANYRWHPDTGVTHAIH